MRFRTENLDYVDQAQDPTISDLDTRSNPPNPAVAGSAGMND